MATALRGHLRYRDLAYGFGETKAVDRIEQGA